MWRSSLKTGKTTLTNALSVGVSPLIGFIVPPAR